MRFVKLILILCLFGGIYFGWSHSGGQNPLTPTMEKVQAAFSFRAHVESKLNRKNYVPLAQIPLLFQQAIISVEDNRFHQHSGLILKQYYGQCWSICSLAN